MTRPHCDRLTWVEGHFTQRITPADEERLRAHLGTAADGCATCRDRYARELLLERLDPRRRDPQTRLGLALGVSSPGPLSSPGQRGESAAPLRRGLLGRGLALAVALTAGVLLASLLLLRLSSQPGGDQARPGFAARGQQIDGGTSRAAELMIYRVGKGRRIAAAQDKIAIDDALAFAYRNPAKHEYLLVFGVDETGQVYWFYPSWQDATKNPPALTIEAGPDLHELPDGVRHAYKGRELTIHAIFGSRRHRVRDVEAELARARAAKRVAFTAEAYEVIRRRFVLIGQEQR